MTTTVRSEARGICVSCGDPVEICEACEREDCEATTCLECLRVEVGQALPQPHTHGG
jgi:hypothetical protein